MFAFFANLKRFIPVLKGYLVDNIFIIALIKAIVTVYWPLLLAIAITVGVTMFIHKSVIYVDPDLAETSTPPIVIPTALPTTSTYSPTIISLDDLQVLNKEPDKAFYFHQWEKNFPIKIDGIEYLHSIGVQLPVDVKYDLITNHSTEREAFSAKIEYSLAYKYDKFQFSYGIDDNAFKDAGLPPPNCHYWVVVESCECKEDS